MWGSGPKGGQPVVEARRGALRARGPVGAMCGKMQITETARRAELRGWRRGIRERVKVNRRDAAFDGAVRYVRVCQNTTPLFASIHYAVLTPDGRG